MRSFSTAFSRMTRFMSEATGALSWSRILVRLLTGMPFVPSNRTRAVTTPPGLSFLIAPSDATTRSGYCFFASSSVSEYLSPFPLVVHHRQDLLQEGTD